MDDVDLRIREALRNSAESFEPGASLSIPHVHKRARVLRAHALVWVLILAAFAASGTLIGLRTTGSKDHGSFVGPVTHSDKTNIEIARREVAHQLDVIRMPPGSKQVANAPTPNLASMPPEGLGGSHLILSSRFWTVPLSRDDTIKWLQQHPPSGLSVGLESGRYSGPNYSGSFITFTDNSTSAYTRATLMFSIEPIGPHSSGVRADGTAVWISNEPVKDTAKGARVRVTIAGGCPATPGDYVGISNPRSHDLERAFIPAAEPTSALRCVYQVVERQNHFEQVLAERRSLGSADAVALAHVVRTLPLGSTGPSNHSCPVLRSGVVDLEIIVFGFPQRPDVDLWHSKFCFGSVSNGFIRTSDSIGSF